MKRSIVSVLCCAMLSVALVPVAAAGNKEASAVADVGFNATGLPIVSKPFSFSAVIMKDPKHGNIPEMGVFKRMEKETGVTVNWIEIPQTNFEEKKNLLLASNDLPDVFMHSLNDSDLLRYGGQGVLVPMETLIEKYAPRIKDLFAKRPDIKKYVTTPDGHIYILPRIQELAHRVNPDNMFINKTWLDKLGLSIPTTADEFYAVMKAFREKDPNGNGKKDELPMSWCSVKNSRQLNVDSFFGTFGMLDNPMHLMVSADKKVYFTANTDNYKNGLAYLNRLYREGLIDPEVFTHDIKQYSAKGKAPDMLYGVFFEWFDENTAGNDRAKKDYVVLPPLKGPDGKQRWNTTPTAVLARQNFAITNKMKNPEVAIRWADQCYDWATSYELCYGSWDVNIKKEGSKVVMLPPPAGRSADEFRYLNSPAYTTPFALYEVDFKNLELTENHIRKFARLDMYRKFFPALEEVYPDAFFLAEEENELAILRTDITNYVDQMRAKFVIGAESVDSGWDTYLKQLNQIGLSRYLELYQKALTRYYR